MQTVVERACWLQVWYCVSPKDRPKFEAMAKTMFPELYSVCPAFMRHKDILFSPKLLRSYGVDYVQVRCKCHVETGQINCILQAACDLELC